MKFNSVNAKEYSVKGVAARRFNREHGFTPVKVVSVEPKPEPTITESYTATRLVRVRKQLDMIDRLMFEEKDPAKLDRLASAQSKLSEQERLLDGRPTPGQLKPGSKPDRRSRQPAQFSAPVPDDTPQQVVPPSNPPSGVNGNGV